MNALNIQKGMSSHSAYDLRDPHAPREESDTLAVLVENEPGVLARVIGLFAGRGYNIDSLTVAEVDHSGHRSRITVVTRGTPEVIGRRQASRPGHFMPASLLASQFETLEPLRPDEAGTVIDVGQSIDSIVDEYVSRTDGEDIR